MSYELDVDPFYLKHQDDRKNFSEGKCGNDTTLVFLHFGRNIEKEVVSKSYSILFFNIELFYFSG